jgi:glycosyltransferase involved in cell wall biosynthesis
MFQPVISASVNPVKFSPIKRLNVLHLSTSDLQGGAARAAYRLHQGLLRQGVDSSMLVQAKMSCDPRVFAPTRRSQQLFTSTRVIWDTLPLKAYPQCKADGNFFPQWLPERVASQVGQRHPDILNLHWISGGFVRLETLARLPYPIVWTLHDMWAFTGGCHYSGTCERYTQTCGACPQLQSQNPRDLSYRVWQRKAKAWQGLNLTLICPSQWLADQVRRSHLFARGSHHQIHRPIHHDIEVIPNGLDLQTYRPIEQGLARQLLRLPPKGQLILFGALQATSDPRKGFDLLQAALQQLPLLQRANPTEAMPQPIEVVIFGATSPENPPDLGFPVHYLGQLQDELSLVLAYAAADVMVVPSRQENLAQTACEALACGTPVVVFDQTGLTTVIEHQVNGYVCADLDSQSLATGMAWVLADPDRLRQLAAQARQRAEQQLDITQMTKAYEAVYARLLSANR